MKIEHHVPQGVTNRPQSVQGPRPESATPPPQGPKVQTDRVELSDRAKALASVQEALQHEPEIRIDKVNELKQQIQNGTYQVPGEKIAERMLGEGLFA